MESILSVIVAFVVAVTGFTGADSAGLSQPAPSSVEVGVSERLPVESALGLAMPASGCSVAEWHPPEEGVYDYGESGSGGCAQLPEIFVCTDDGSRSIIRVGDETNICWDNNGIDGCFLSGYGLPGTLVNEEGRSTVNPTSNAVYTISCGSNSDYTDRVTVRVLPVIQES